MVSSSFFLLLLLLLLLLLPLLFFFRGFVSHHYKALRRKPIDTSSSSSSTSSSSSSSSGLRWKYDVFINFRGEDTRRGFVSHLYRALCQKPLNTFIDSEDLRKGDRLSELLTAIRESRLSIVVFSQSYASSTWCLKELVQILECNDNKNQIIVPIFYEVDPSDIRRLKGNFAEGFAKHERHSHVDVKEVQSWRSALARATDLSGWDSKNYKDDAELIEKIVEDVFKKLICNSSTSSKDNGLVGMDSHMHKMHLILHPHGVETNTVRIVGIWGMGGLGKTTIARAVYDEIACRFEASCFLENVKEGFMKHGKLHMQTQLLLSLSNIKVGCSDISNKGFQVMLKSLGQRKVLIVVDDVDKLEQIEALLGEQHSFGGGSRIIITTRDLQLLSRTNATYQPKIFSDSGALELFKRYAFRNNQPTKDYDHLSRHAIQYAQGLPLALKVLGAFLDNKTVSEWENVLEKIRKIPLRGVHDVLKTSFDGLDDTEKNIFLDIACFFKGMDKDYATEILDGCGFYPRTGITVLINRALITVSEEGKLEMHDSLEEMGREIVRQESIKDPGRRSRLWNYEDVHHVLTQNTATEAVESIILDLSNSREVRLNPEAFVSMTQLRLLKINPEKYQFFNDDCCKQHLNGHLKFLSSELRSLSWLGLSPKSLPSNFQFKNLVDLDIRFSRIDRLWEGTQTLEKLKFINLSYCRHLKETPDFTKAPNLERLILERCTSLVKVHPSIWTLTNLVLLNLIGCKGLKILASNIHMKYLKTLGLEGCSNLEIFPEISEVMEGVSELNLSGSKVKELPSSIQNLTGLRILVLKDCKELQSLPRSIHMKSLNTLDLSGCSNLEMFPEISEVMEKLSVLNLSESKVKELPSSIHNLTGLCFLVLKDCKELKSLPSSIHMKSLDTLDLSGCSNLEIFVEISEVMKKLSVLNLSESKVKELPSIHNLTGLHFLVLKDCKELKSLPSNIHMKSLRNLDVSGCSNLEMFLEISEVMNKLSILNLSESKIKELPSVHNLTGLRSLVLKDCKELKSLSNSIHMKFLTTLDLSGCSSLEMFPEIAEIMGGVHELNLSESKVKELPSSINNLTGLYFLVLKDCKELKSLPSSIHMTSLKTLDLSGCSSLEMFPEISEVMKELSYLNLSGSKIKELSSSINNLTRLSWLDLQDCKELKSLPSSICQLKSLRYVSLSGCTKFEAFPSIEENMEELRELHLDGTCIRELSPWIERLQGLVILNLRNCESLLHLPDTLWNLAHLSALNVCGCSNLSQFPLVLNSEDLERLWDSAVGMLSF
ncbi:disease resistance protein RPV1-like [Pyrus communis]|uniref:disease resistance protein RPV1-like n=1 Tax=Pyrus communis TaxID=23211 RepID=UPI0035BEE0D8